MALLKLNSTGAEVSLVQSQLGIKVTGTFDQSTKEAVIKFQKQHGLMADGIVGDSTRTAMFGMNKNVIKDDAYWKAADTLKVHPAALKAFAKVEAAGNGFLVDGRPKILYERHWAYRLLDKAGRDVKSMEALIPRIVNSSAGDYLADSGSWQKFEIMFMMDPDVAIQSCSWGTFQIMGFHFRRLGFLSPTEMMNAAYVSADAHLDMLVNFIKTDKELHKALTDQKWTDVAVIYNGSGQKGYDARLKTAFEEYKAFYLK